jgi:uncharacterized protein (DUF58 family)
MTIHPSPRLRAYVTAGLVGLAVALAAGNPAPAMIGTAFLILGVLGVTGGQALKVDVTLVETPVSMVEGEQRVIRLRFKSEGGRAGRTYARLNLSEGIKIVEARGARLIGRQILMLASVGDQNDVVLTVEIAGWGRHNIGPIHLFTESPLGMFDVRRRSSENRTWVVIPEKVALRRLLAPLETNLHVGDLVSSHRGPGSEFADLRSYRPGDDPRDINWRVSSRSEGLWVNERHPERNGDVVLLIDGQVESGTELHNLVDRSVRLGVALLQAHARRHHRLGLITLDGTCRWVGPGMGETHRRRLVEQLVGVIPGQVLWEAVERSVLRAAKRPALVIALTPLLDGKMAGVLYSLRRSGIDVAVIEIDASSELSEPDGRDRRMGRRIWSMERERLRERLSGAGVPVAVWKDIDSPDVPLSQLELWRSSWQRQLG